MRLTNPERPALRSYTVIAIAVIITMVTSVQCAKKFRDAPDEMDAFDACIAGIKDVLPPDRAFSLELINTKQEYELFTRYFLVPRRMFYPVVATDTVLVINRAGETDSVMKYSLNNKKILWQNKDSQNTYTLICSQ